MKHITPYLCIGCFVPCIAMQRAAHTILIDAINSGDFKAACTAFHESGEHDYAALLRTISTGQYDMFRYFATHGTDCSHDRHVFNLACSLEHLEFVQYLVEHGAPLPSDSLHLPVSGSQKIYSYLHYFIFFKQSDPLSRRKLLAQLLELPLTMVPFCTDKQQLYDQLLRWAVVCNDEISCLLLMERGACPTTLLSGYTALELATERGNAHMVELMNRHGMQR